MSETVRPPQTIREQIEQLKLDATSRNYTDAELSHIESYNEAIADVLACLSVSQKEQENEMQDDHAREHEIEDATDRQLREIVRDFIVSDYVEYGVTSNAAAMLQPLVERAYALGHKEARLASPQAPQGVIDKIVQRVAELPDRTSPDDWPEAMLVTSAELTAILNDACLSVREEGWQPIETSRLGCRCACRDHGDGSDCACDCHRKDAP